MAHRRSAKPTMTDQLREALAEAESLRAIERATGVKRQSMMKFLRGEQSLRLDKADKLAKHFGVESRRAKRKG
jgi:plasmid maintenance system antidote protein VapI